MNTSDLQQMIASLVASQKETDRILTEKFSETDRMLSEKFAETDRMLNERFAETDRQFKETDRQLKETDRKLRSAHDLFNDQWGKLVEALMASGLPALFRTRGLRVTDAGRNVEFFADSGRKLAQVDVMVRNGDEDVAVEVKTTCRPQDVGEHIERLARVRAAKQSYSEGTKKLYGALAALSFVADADRYAERKGLFVLKCGDGVTTIGNAPGFKPKAF